MLGRALGASPIIATDISPERRKMAEDLNLVDHALPADDTAGDTISEVTGGRGCVVRVFALENTRTWGRCAFVGEGGQITFPVSELLIHKQITLYGSWVTSLRHMEDLLEHLMRWNLHPDRIVTHRYSLEQADEAYRVADQGAAGKVCIVLD
jgi:threonine dehydrogenase-like Zn-dependent dehydrogenase